MLPSRTRAATARTTSSRDFPGQLVHTNPVAVVAEGFAFGTFSLEAGEYRDEGGDNLAEGDVIP